MVHLADDHPSFGRKTHAHMPEGLRKAGWEGTWFDTYSGRAANRWLLVMRSGWDLRIIAREAGRLAVDRRRDIVALFLVEAWRLNTERRQRDPGAAASSAFLFCHRQYAAANPCAAPIFWQKEPGDIDEPEIRTVRVARR